MNGWLGVDFDSTLAIYHPGQYPELGEPVPKMVEHVKQWLKGGYEVRIVTARASEPDQVKLIEEWCLKHVGRKLRVTDKKDFDMLYLFDDRCIQVERNTGRLITDEEW